MVEFCVLDGGYYFVVFLFFCVKFCDVFIILVGIGLFLVYKLFLFIICYMDKFLLFCGNRLFFVNFFFDFVKELSF